MLADVGMVKTYSKSAHVNDLGFVWTGPPPCCMDQLPPPLLPVTTFFPPGGFAIHRASLGVILAPARERLGYGILSSKIQDSRRSVHPGLLPRAPW